MVGVAVVGEGVDGDSSSWGEYAFDFEVPWVHKAYEVFHDDVYAVFVKVAVVAEAEEVKFEAFALDHVFAWYVVYDDGGEVGLSGLRA